MFHHQCAALLGAVEKAIFHTPATVASVNTRGKKEICLTFSFCLLSNLPEQAVFRRWIPLGTEHAAFSSSVPYAWNRTAAVFPIWLLPVFVSPTVHVHLNSLICYKPSCYVGMLAFNLHRNLDQVNLSFCSLLLYAWTSIVNMKWHLLPILHLSFWFPLAAIWDFSKYPILCSIIQVWNDIRVNKWWPNFQFWVDYTFKNINGKQTSILTVI